MTDTGDPQFDGSLLQRRTKELQAVMDNPQATQAQKLDVIMSCMELIMLVNLGDHPRTLRMWAVFQPMAWTMLIAFTGLIGLAVAGHFTITYIP